MSVCQGHQSATITLHCRPPNIHTRKKTQMTYLDYINRFWSEYLRSPKVPSSDEALLFFVLLYYFNQNFWEAEYMTLETSHLQQMLRWERKKIIRVRNKLKQRGIIDFRQGKGSASPEYKITLFSDETRNNDLCSQNATQNTIVLPNGNTNATQMPHKSKVPPTPLLNIQDNKIKYSLCAGVSAYACMSAPPTKEEVVGYAREMSISSKDAESFYAHYSASAWTMGNGQPVVDWRQKMIEWDVNPKFESIRGRFRGPNVTETSRRGHGNEKVETQTPGSNENESREIIQSWINRFADRSRGIAIANRAMQIKGNYLDALHLIKAAYQDNNEEARKILES